MRIAKASATSVTVAFAARDAQALAVILSYASNAYDQEQDPATLRRAAKVFNALAAIAEHLDGDARTFFERQDRKFNKLYHQARAALDPGYLESLDPGTLS